VRVLKLVFISDTVCTAAQLTKHASVERHRHEGCSACASEESTEERMHKTRNEKMHTDMDKQPTETH
jgi:positive regulator of sigma E activity